MLGILFLKGLAVGLLASIPLGPIGVICIQRTINRGRWYGFASGYGAVLADTIFATIAAYGLSAVIDFVRSYTAECQIFGGLIILGLGLIIYLRDPVRAIRRKGKTRGGYAKTVGYTMLLTLTNPLAIFLFLALMAAFEVVLDTAYAGQLMIVIVGIHLGATCWWFTLTSLVYRLRARFRFRHIYWFNKVAGLAIAVMGLLAALWGFKDLLQI